MMTLLSYQHDIFKYQHDILNYQVGTVKLST
jgi:hypothetical protein